MEDQDNNKQRVRCFKCFYENTTFGRFKGKIPKQAANKAFTALLKRFKKQNIYDGASIRFSIIEMTRGFEKKSFTYNGRRINLHPVQVTIRCDGRNKQILYKYKNVIKRDLEYELDI